LPLKSLTAALKPAEPWRKPGSIWQEFVAWQLESICEDRAPCREAPCRLLIITVLMGYLCEKGNFLNVPLRQMGDGERHETAAASLLPV